MGRGKTKCGGSPSEAWKHPTAVRRCGWCPLRGSHRRLCPSTTRWAATFEINGNEREKMKTNHVWVPPPRMKTFRQESDEETPINTPTSNIQGISISSQHMPFPTRYIPGKYFPREVPSTSSVYFEQKLLFTGSRLQHQNL